MQISQSLSGRLIQTVWLNVFVALMYWGVSHVIWTFFREFGMLPAPIWPAAALALCMALSFGTRVAVGIYLGAVLANGLSLQAPLLTALEIAVTNTLAPLLAAYLIRRYVSFMPPFKTLQDIFIFALFGVVIHAAITATGGVTALLLEGRLSLEAAPFAWMRWWLAHAGGVVLLGPTLILWWQQPRLTLLQGRWDEFLVLFVVANLAAFSIFFLFDSHSHISPSLPWLLIIILAWCSARFSQRETSLLLTTLLTIALVATVMNKGPFTQHSDISMVSLGLMGLVFSFTALVLGAVSAERREKAHQVYQVIQHSPVAKLVYEQETGKIIMVNDALVKCFGALPQDTQYISQWFRHVCSEFDDCEHLETHWHQLEQQAQQHNGVAQLETQLRNQALSLRYIRISMAAIGVRYMATFSDLTEIHAFNEALEQRVAQRTEDLHRSNEELRVSLEQLQETQVQLVEAEKMAALGRLVAGVAHEINTPVGISVTAASHLQMKLAEHQSTYKQGQLTRSAFEDLLIVADESSAMIQANLLKAADLIRSFKQVAVDQVYQEKRSFQLFSYLEEIVHTLQPRLKSTPHTIQLDCTADIKLSSYPGAFSQIISNLILNSLKHGFHPEQAGKIEIHVIQEKAGLIIDYCDDGKGIDAEHLPHIFEPFFTTARGQGGTGLGLHIVYNLVTQTLGGQLECQSQPGHGVQFRMNLPL